MNLISDEFVENKKRQYFEKGWKSKFSQRL